MPDVTESALEKIWACLNKEFGQAGRQLFLSDIHPAIAEMERALLAGVPHCGSSECMASNRDRIVSNFTDAGLFETFPQGLKISTNWPDCCP